MTDIQSDDIKSVDKITTMKESIESMNKEQQIHILKILKEHNVSINENTNGTFINMSHLSHEILHKLSDFIDHMKTQDVLLGKNETIKNSYKENYFNSS